MPQLQHHEEGLLLHIHATIHTLPKSAAASGIAPKGCFEAVDHRSVASAATSIKQLSNAVRPLAGFRVCPSGGLPIPMADSEVIMSA